ncbi:HdeD family acid-resistance protein [Psychrobacter sp. I-STPA10]|uniref:HdeD family acid-resistance protein n=1 Tax=Psychrobacter sp. I-STPA10 TaxID=2585769 RepID=UPI001E43544C|nr:DUF308 domain-containing protein [Psychrobacter sp. I-STPA10]
MNKTVWLIIGILSILGGIFAFINPLSASMAVEIMAGWFFLLIGVIQVISLFSAKGATSKLLAVVSGIIGILIGIELLQDPLQGVVTLTLVVAILFLLSGAVKIFTSFHLRGTPLFIPALVSGLISILLACLIFSDFPQSATSILGILLAVELVMNGITFISFSRHQDT